MKSTNFTTSVQSIKKAYNKPKLVKHGKMSRITLKGGSLTDADMTNTFQA